MSGWVKIHRQMRESSCYRDSDAKAVWLECILRANFSETKIKIGQQTVTLQAGQFITSREKMAETLNVQQSKIQRVLKWLESEHQIKQQSYSKFRVITVLNWKEYQGDNQEIEQQVNSKRTANEQQMNTDKKERKKESKKDTPPTPSENLFADEDLPRRKKQNRYLTLSQVTVEMLAPWVKENIQLPIDVKHELLKCQNWDFKRPVRDGMATARTWMLRAEDDYRKKGADAPTDKWKDPFGQKGWK
jgi:DNA-binding transcriptional regulator YhcF (GntR family)